jgi:hypothetical protein
MIVSPSHHVWIYRDFLKIVIENEHTQTKQLSGFSLQLSGAEASAEI